MEDRSKQHQRIQQSMEDACATLPLCQVPTDIVMGQGNLHADIMLIGEAPGANEAIQRIPFVGRGGKLLNETLAKAGIQREDCYVSNIVKVRPPDNRDPLPEEIEAFLPYLKEEMTLIQPKLFVTLGRFSMNFFLPEEKISANHGVLRRFLWNGQITYLLPQYHPAAALRNSSIKQQFELDIAKIPQALAYINEKEEHDKTVASIRDTLL